MCKCLTEPPTSHYWMDRVFPISTNAVFYAFWIWHGKTVLGHLPSLKSSLESGRQLKHEDPLSFLEVLLISFNILALGGLTVKILGILSKPGLELYENRWLVFLWTTTAVSISASFGVVVSMSWLSIPLMIGRSMSEMSVYLERVAVSFISVVGIVLTVVMFTMADNWTERAIVCVLVGDTMHYWLLLHVLLQREWIMVSTLVFHHGYDFLCTGGLLYGYYHEIGWEAQPVINTAALVYMYHFLPKKMTSWKSLQGTDHTGRGPGDSVRVETIPRKID